jgi:DNA-binding MarR family transcriptional regulator
LDGPTNRYSAMRNFSPPSPSPQPREAAEWLRELILAVGRRRSLRDPLADMYEMHGFTPPQVHALAWLGTDGALTMGVLAQRLGVTEKTVTGIVDRLEGQRLAERVRDEADRRIVHVRLTNAGRAAHDRMRHNVLSQLERLMAVLDVEDRGQLLRIIQTLTDRLTAAEDAP